VLILFEAGSILKVIYHKSTFSGVNVSDSWLHDAAAVMHCKHGRIPFSYLGLPIDGDPRKLKFWYLLIDRIKKKVVWLEESYRMGLEITCFTLLYC